MFDWFKLLLQRGMIKKQLHDKVGCAKTDQNRTGSNLTDWFGPIFP